MSEAMRGDSQVTAPTAAVLGRGPKWVAILCPYCGNEHRHSIETHTTSARVAPGCGMVRTPEQRITGYRFTMTSESAAA